MTPHAFHAYEAARRNLRHWAETREEMSSQELLKADKADAIMREALKVLTGDENVLLDPAVALGGFLVGNVLGFRAMRGAQGVRASIERARTTRTAISGETVAQHAMDTALWVVEPMVRVTCWTAHHAGLTVPAWHPEDRGLEL